MGIIRAKLTEVLGAAETTALLGEEAPRAPKKTAARAALPEGAQFIKELRSATVASEALTRFVNAIRE
jgi:hypothetical protein